MNRIDAAKLFDKIVEGLRRQAIDALCEHSPEPQEAPSPQVLIITTTAHDARVVAQKLGLRNWLYVTNRDMLVGRRGCDAVVSLTRWRRIDARELLESITVNQINLYTVEEWISAK